MNNKTDLENRILESVFTLDKVKKFLDDWKETENDDTFNFDDYQHWMESAIDLLKELSGYDPDNEEDEED